MAGRTFVSTEATKYRKLVDLELMEQRVPRAKLSGSLEITIVVCPPTRRRLDIANREKVVSDALQLSGVIEDDSCFDRVVIERGAIVKDGRLEITLRSLGVLVPVQADLLEA